MPATYHRRMRARSQSGGGVWGGGGRQGRKVGWCAAPVLVAVTILFLLVSMPALAQPAPKPIAGAAAAPPVEAESVKLAPPGHGWLIIPDRDDPVTAVLHLPPRTGPGAARDGSMRIAPGLAHTAEQVAWWHSRVYVLLAEDRTAPVGTADWQRRILSLGVVRSISGGWEYPPGRFEVVAAIPARGKEVLAFGATRLGPLLLVRHSRGEWIVPGRGAPEPRQGDLELVLYSAGAWRSLPIPWLAAGADQTPSDVWLASSGEELAVLTLARSGDLIRCYRTTLGPSWTDQGVIWASSDLPYADAQGRPLPPPRRVMLVDGQVIASAWEEGPPPVVRLIALRDGKPAEEFRARMENVPREHAVSAMDGSRRVAVIWNQAPTPVESGSPGRARQRPRADLQVREVSVDTGRILYAGPLRADHWFSAREYQVLAIMLVLVMASVVVFVLRAEPTSAPVLPTNVLLAEPSRRLFAAAIDYLPAALIMESVMNLPTGSLLFPLPGGAVPSTFWPFLGTLGVAAGVGTVMEWLFGRTVGKLLTGCAVVSVRRTLPKTPNAPPAEASLGRAGLGQCLVRNFVKWSAPMLAMFILFDPARRHPGDLIARTLVVMVASSEPKE